MKNRSVAEHIRLYQEIFGYLEKRGLRLAVHKIDNECTQELKYIIVHQHKNKLELVPSHDHRTNPAEKCIDTFSASYFWTKRHGPKFPFATLVTHSAAVTRYPKHAAHLPPPPSYVILHMCEG